MDYFFNNLGRMSYDKQDNSQQSVQNTKLANWTLANYFSHKKENSLDESIRFVSHQPTMNIHGMVSGHGLNSSNVDYESVLLLKQEKERPLEKLQLNQRPFITVPYLGRGSYSPEIEGSLRMGNMFFDRKSDSTVMDKNFMPYILPPAHEENKLPEAEEFVMNGWARGGVPSREIGEA